MDINTEETTITLTEQEKDELSELVADKKLNGDNVTTEQEQTLESLYKKLTSDRKYTLGQLHEDLQTILFNYLYFHSRAELVEFDAEEEAGIIADRAVTQIEQLEGGDRV